MDSDSFTFWQSHYSFAKIGMTTCSTTKAHPFTLTNAIFDDLPLNRHALQWLQGLVHKFNKLANR